MAQLVFLGCGCGLGGVGRPGIRAATVDAPRTFRLPPTRPDGGVSEQRVLSGRRVDREKIRAVGPPASRAFYDSGDLLFGCRGNSELNCCSRSMALAGPWPHSTIYLVVGGSKRSEVNVWSGSGDRRPIGAQPGAIVGPPGQLRRAGVVQGTQCGRLPITFLQHCRPPGEIVLPASLQLFCPCGRRPSSWASAAELANPSGRRVGVGGGGGQEERGGGVPFCGFGGRVWSCRWCGGVGVRGGGWGEGVSPLKLRGWL